MTDFNIFQMISTGSDLALIAVTYVLFRHELRIHTLEIINKVRGNKDGS